MEMVSMDKKNVLYILTDEWADFEFAHVGASVHFFRDYYRNVLAGIKKEPVVSIGGLTVIPDVDIHEAKELPFDTLVLIGGNTWRQTDCPELDNFVKKAAAEGKTVAGICNAAAYLGTIGVLNDVSHTANDLEELKEWAGDRYTNEAGFLKKQVVSDKNIITANGTAYLEFAREVMLTLREIPEEGVRQWYALYKNGFYPE